ncbi:PREDICTED: vasoactive intestinal polypeptide receptor 2 [Gekko japonicus]|uniref:Vasoactive intestinal polypeptide receptor 2 n=1 Tax=Gekko japonicus TaxID=146911 RepID=A0ABM1KKS7_GEKJA|nr:PREDICTED: vasoactive intestinal polypeptide receptor 2 [Gekko japonicus]
MQNFALFLLSAGWTLGLVNGIHPECRLQLEIHEEEMKCKEMIKSSRRADFKGCVGSWDNLTCWHSAEFGEIVTVPCPKLFSHFFSKPGNISKKCTSRGWTDIFPDFLLACGFKDIDETSTSFYVLVKAIYTLGHSASLIALTTGSIILCVFRKLHCTRNYIHLNLFLSFILRAISVLIKDEILYSGTSTDQCPDEQPSLAENSGIPTVFIVMWTVSRIYLENTGCWDTNEHSGPWWIIKLPILISILVNFILFISIIRILLQKLRSPDVGGNDQSQYKRLAKSTLLLIPLFGVHYMVFAVFPIRISHKYQIIFELCLGSFQGLVVAVLYCFLNSEVQGELKRKWRSWCLNQRMGRDYKLHSSSISRNGSESISQLHRNSTTQFSLQTETSVI